MDLNVYIGYDQKEHIAAEVCKFSMKRRTPAWVEIDYLKSEMLPEFTRPREPHQATDFTYTRFLVPYLSDFVGWSIFCDCDFLFVGDIARVFKHVDKTKAVSVVQHPSYNPRSQVKMNGISQVPMHRKNWASFIVFNNAHPALQVLTPEFVNTFPGRSLHQFGWLKDSELGSLPLEWNCLDDYYLLDRPQAIHYTDGGPWFEKYQNTMYSSLWLQELKEYEAATKHV